VRFSSSDVTPRAPAPRIGEHTEEVLRELGVAAGRIAALRELAVIP